MSTRIISQILSTVHEDDKNTVFTVKFLNRENAPDVTICAADLSIREKFPEYAADDMSTAADLQRQRNEALLFLFRRIKQLNNARAKIVTLNRADILVSDKKEKDED